MAYQGFSGDLGKSMTTSAPVAEELAKHIVPTLSLTLASLVLTVLISVPLGVYCAVYRDRLLDNIVRIFSFLGISMPSFLSHWFCCGFSA